MAKESSSLDKKERRLKIRKRVRAIPSTSMGTTPEKAHLYDEMRRLRIEVEQRAAELAIVNSVQQGLASKLDMQAIYDLVGDQIRDLFNAQSILILTFNPETRTRQIKYNFEKGQRFYSSDLLPYNKLTEYLIATKKPLVINRDGEAKRAEFQMIIAAGTEKFKSAVFIPFLAGEEVKGFISLQNIEQENAYSDSDVSLLSTFASSMSITLENTRLFDETQRLLQETEQRAAELVIVNTVQAGLAEGLASKRDIQAIYDLIGNKIRELFPNADTEIRAYDPKMNLFQVPYYIENGQRFTVDPISLSDATMSAHVLRTGQTLVVNENISQEMEKYGAIMMRGRKYPARSAVFVPWMVASEARGLIVLGNVERENAFSPSDVRLLQTLANSMSTALENARLFDETQHLLQETEQRAAELGIINNVQEGLASKLDMQAIYDLVGDKIRDLFNAQAVLIIMFDPSTRTRQIKYNFENGQRFYISEAFPYNRLTEHLIATKKTLVINQDAEIRVAEFGMILSPGTEVMKSGVFVPLLVGAEVKGFISVQNVEQENVFSESDVNLLSTFASSMSVALENARLYQEQLQVAEELKRVDRMKTQFLSSMSHELRTPLNAIINFVEMMARGMIGPVSQDQEELLDQTLDSSKHLLQLINDVLDISKIQAGRLTLFTEEGVNLHEEAEGVLNIVSGLAQQKGLQLVRDIDPHLPLIECDRRRVRQVLLNLLSNAIKFTEEGTVTLSAKKRKQEVLFAIIDTGPGIPAAKQELIFEPFMQGEEGEKKFQGTGLGLPISRSLVQAHGGELWLESQSGEGAAFFFTLPVSERGVS